MKSPSPLHARLLALALISLAYAPASLAIVVPDHVDALVADKPSESDRGKLLNRLFVKLKTASDEAEARQVETVIWQLWFSSENPVIAGMMEEISVARRSADYARAIQLLDILIQDHPDYAEAWNQRATIYYLMGDFDASLADVVETLAREPRHFGALAGRAAIYWQQGNKEMARESLREAIKIHPYLRDRGMLSQ